MKNLFLSLFFCLTVSSVTVYAQDWQWVSPLPQGNNILTSQLCDNGTGYMAGNHGTLLKTADYGWSWSLLPGQLSGAVQCLCFISPDTGFAVSYHDDNSMFYRTVNGGLAWDSILFPGTSLNVTLFMDANTGFIGGDLGVIKKTTDGGTTWTDGFYNQSSSIMQFSPLDTQVIFGSTREGEIIRTADGGLTWSRIISGVSDAPFVHFFNEQTGIYTSTWDSHIYKTYNGGSTWWPKNNGEIYANSLRFFDQATGVVSSRNGDIYSTTDQGETWQLNPSSLPSTHFFTASFINPQQGIMGGSTGATAVLPGDSTSLVRVSRSVSNNNLMGMFFINDSIAFVGSDHGKIYTTTDRWDTWDSLTIPFEASIYKLSFPDAQTGYALAVWGEYRIYKTTDGGETWQQLSSLSGEDIYDMVFLDSNIGIISTSNGIYRTADGGLSWSVFLPVDGYIPEHISFANANTGYVSGYNLQNEGSTYKTTNSGHDWVMLTGGIPRLASLKALTADTVYAVGNTTIYFKSTDGTVSWDAYDALKLAGVNYAHDIDFISPNRGICTGTSVYGDGGMIAETSDGGATWQQTKHTEWHLGNIVVIPSTATWYVTGQLGTMLRKTDTTIVSTSHIIPPRQTMVISPNPASAEITITFPGQITTPADISIFNSQGMSVYSASCNKQTQLNFNISFLKPGLYIVRVTTTELIGTGKLVIGD